MAIRVDCPKCKQTLEAPDELGGRTAICPNCRTKMQLPIVTDPIPAGPAPVPTPSQPAAKSVAPRTAPTMDPAQPVERIEFMVSDLRAVLQSINRKLGCLIVVFVFAVVAGIAAAVILIHQAARLVL